MLTFSTFVLWLHITAIAVWVGGMFAIPLISVPVLKAGIASPKESARLSAVLIGRFQRVSREVILLIVLTGLFNLINAGAARGFDFSGQYIRMLIIKVSLFIVIIAIQVWQSYRLTEGFESILADATPDTVGRLHRRFLLTSLLNLVFAATLILLGLMLRYGK